MLEKPECSVEIYILLLRCTVSAFYSYQGSLFSVSRAFNAAHEAASDDDTRDQEMLLIPKQQRAMTLLLNITVSEIPTSPELLNSNGHLFYRTDVKHVNVTIFAVERYMLYPLFKCTWVIAPRRY